MRIKICQFKIAKAIQERVKRLDDHNVRLNKKDLSVKSDTIIESDSDTADLFEITSSEDEIKRCQQYTNNRLSENGAKCQQPSNEMQLESKTKHQRFSNERSLEGEIKHSQKLQQNTCSFQKKNC